MQQHRVSVYDTYIDDGWSGTNFDRPSVNRMMQDIEAKKVNMVITKDLSRLGRDYIMTGHYMERYFPEHRVRYISLLDGIDTGVDSTANDITPFRAIMNDMYAKDISKKIKSVKRDKVRYISLLDGIDTGVDSTANDITPFRAIMNDMYAKDISKKIKSVKRDKQRKGLFIGGKPVYGYKMHPTEKNHRKKQDRGG